MTTKLPVASQLLSNQNIELKFDMFSFIKLSKFNISLMEYSRTLNEVFLKS